MKCKYCKHFSPPGENELLRYGKAISGVCDHDKWVASYWTDCDHDGVLVECDEGWGFRVGPEFGCIHFVSRPPTPEEIAAFAKLPAEWTQEDDDNYYLNMGMPCKE